MRGDSRIIAPAALFDNLRTGFDCAAHLRFVQSVTAAESKDERPSTAAPTAYAQDTAALNKQHGCHCEDSVTLRRRSGQATQSRCDNS